MTNDVMGNQTRSLRTKPIYQVLKETRLLRTKPLLYSHSVHYVLSPFFTVIQFITY